jgi:transposase
MRATVVESARVNEDEVAQDKIAVWLLKRGKEVHIAIITNAKKETLLPIINEKVQPDSMVYTYSF